MDGFWISFLANLASDAILAIAIFVIVTQPGEKRKTRKRNRQSLGLLKAETEINKGRATAYLASLAELDDALPQLFPLRFTRGAWNSLRESGFLAGFEDPRLAYFLFRMNETGLVANKNLRRLELAYLEETGGNRRLIADTACANVALFAVLVDKVLALLQHVQPVGSEEIAALASLRSAEGDSSP